VHRFLRRHPVALLVAVGLPFNCLSTARSRFYTEDYDTIDVQEGLEVPEIPLRFPDAFSTRKAFILRKLFSSSISLCHQKFEIH
jgi:hypothetical protein